jgi:hypothetical protein
MPTSLMVSTIKVATLVAAKESMASDVITAKVAAIVAMTVERKK